MLKCLEIYKYRYVQELLKCLIFCKLPYVTSTDLAGTVVLQEGSERPGFPSQRDLSAQDSPWLRLGTDSCRPTEPPAQLRPRFGGSGTAAHGGLSAMREVRSERSAAQTAASGDSIPAPVRPRKLPGIQRTAVCRAGEESEENRTASFVLSGKNGQYRDQSDRAGSAPRRAAALAPGMGTRSGGGC